MDRQLEYFVSARDGNLSKVARLLESGVSIDSENAGGATALEMASESGQLDVVRFLIENGARIDPIERPCFSSALITSSTNHHGEIVELLLQNGADPNLTDSEGQTALMWAAFHGAPMRVIYAIISKGAQVHTRDRKGRTARDYAAEAGHKHISDYLQGLANPDSGTTLGNE